MVVSQSPTGLYVGWAVTRWRGAPLIFNEHRQIGFSLTRRRELMVRLIRRWIDLVIVVAPGQTQAWIDRGYPAERAVVIHNGVERAEVLDHRSAIRFELGISDGSVVATLVASLRPEKHVTEFVRAVRSARESYPELMGMIVGDGPDRPAIEAAVDGDSAIRLLGHRDDVPRILKAADVFVLSSQYEASPIAVLEAMSAGLPVVALDVGAVGDMVEDGQTGFLVTPGAPELMASKLTALISDPGLRRAMGTPESAATSRVGMPRAWSSAMRPSFVTSPTGPLAVAFLTRKRLTAKKRAWGGRALTGAAAEAILASSEVR